MCDAQPFGHVFGHVWFRPAVTSQLLAQHMQINRESFTDGSGLALLSPHCGLSIGTASAAEPLSTQSGGHVVAEPPGRQPRRASASSHGCRKPSTRLPVRVTVTAVRSF